MAFGLPQLAAAVRQFCAENLPGRTPLRIRIYILEEQEPLQLPLSAATLVADSPDAVFVPNAFQTAILEALAGKGMRSTALARALHCETSRLFKKPRGALPELQREGLVEHHDRIGYYRPDAPPPQLSDLSEE